MSIEYYGIEGDWSPLPSFSNIIWTNGCYDILHLGHLELLSRCKNESDKLNNCLVFVGLDSEKRIKIYKGKPEIIANSPDQITIVSENKSSSSKNSDDYTCFRKSELQGGFDLWKGDKDEKCVKKEFINCYVDNTDPYRPSVCEDRRDGSLLSLTD
jgi:cytidyltransferase-like protein